ncbi:MAG: hypothetical protein NVSMB5_02950 [Candidatus Velthaea sp.]
MSVARIIGCIAAIVICGVLLFAEMWTIAPGFTLPTLAFAVAIPEVAPWGVLASLAGLVAAQFLARGWPRGVATGFAALALGCAFVPLLLLGPAISDADRQMQAALGPDYAVAAPDRERALLRPQPFDIATSFGGYPPLRDVRSTLGLPVPLRDGTSLALDLYRPHTAGARPTIVLVYGGAWIFGKRADMAQRARTFASLGYTVVVADYRHAPAHRYPTQIDDVRDAIAHMARHAAAWDIDPARVAIMGYSAGAELALLAGYEPEPVTIKAVIAYYSPIDLVLGYRLPPVPDPANVRSILTAYIGSAPELNPDAYRDASPIAHIHAGLPPTLLLGGGRDELVRLSFQHQMRDALHVHGIRVASLDFPWANHAFDDVPNGLGGQLSRYYTERFLAATL